VLLRRIGQLLAVLVVALLSTACRGRESSTPDSGDFGRETPASAAPFSISSPAPPSTLLSPGSAELELSVQTNAPSSCRYAVNGELGFGSMTPFDSSGNTTWHSTTIAGLDPSPAVLNEVTVRCDADPEQSLDLIYRSLPEGAPGHPRTSSLWGIYVNEWADQETIDSFARYDLIVLGEAPPEAIERWRELNPAILVLASFNAVECNDYCDLPMADYLTDIHGQRVEIWPDGYRLNLTRPEVAERIAEMAYRMMVGDNLIYDGLFVDNVFLSQSWLQSDIYGNPFRVDADEDGAQDDPEELDAAWKAGVLHELETLHELMPNALYTGHAVDLHEPLIAEIFNGKGFGFGTVDVIEGRGSWGGSPQQFTDLWQEYRMWNELAREPRIVSVESAVPHEIAYGYSYLPWEAVPEGVLSFAQHYYPYMRFGLAFTLMHDGYFAHEYGDTWHGNSWWWYDELDFDLGEPLGPARYVGEPLESSPQLLRNGGFEAGFGGNWGLAVADYLGAEASMSSDLDAIAGSASLRIDVDQAAEGISWSVAARQPGVSLEEGTRYTLSFWAKSDRVRRLVLNAVDANWQGFGLWRQTALHDDWYEYGISFVADRTLDDAAIIFEVGDCEGTVWLDEVGLRAHPAGTDVLRREYENGLVLLNATRLQQVIEVGPGFRRLEGEQAAMVEYIVDDADAAFSCGGSWSPASYDTGLWTAEPPYYHDWGDGLHEGTGEARWWLDVPLDDQYTITAWWPSCPATNGWNDAALFEVVAGEQVAAAMVLDQRTAEDGWHLVAEGVWLASGDSSYVRLTCSGGPCAADALHVRSSARYNDGSSVRSVTLQPMDGIVLQRDNR